MGHHRAADSVADARGVVGAIVIARIDVRVFGTVAGIEATVIGAVMVGMALLQRVVQALIVE